MRLFVWLAYLLFASCLPGASLHAAESSDCICLKDAWNNGSGAQPINESEILTFVESEAAITCRNASGHEYSISSKHPTKVTCVDTNGKKDVIRENRIVRFLRKEDHNRTWDVDPQKEIERCKRYLSTSHGCKAP